MQLQLMHFVTMIGYPTINIDITANHIPPSLGTKSHKKRIHRSLTTVASSTLTAKRAEDRGSASQPASTHYLRDVDIFPLNLLVR